MKRLVASVLLALACLAPARAEEAQHPQVGLALLQPRGLPVPARRRAIEGLLSAVARRTSVETVSGQAPLVAPSDGRLFDYPLVILSGDAPLAPFDERELDAMRAYLSLGGMVLVDDAGGKADSPFLRSARTELARALGGRPVVPLPRDHAIFRAFYLLDRAWGRTDASQDLEAILVGGRAAVVFSANDILGALERDELGHHVNDVAPGGSEQRERAIRTGVNVVLYALCLDYKEDLVHLPLILERRR